MSDRFHVVRDAGEIFRIVFDDGAMNVLSSDALAELRGAVREIPGDARIVTFRSGRPNVFAAGADMREMKEFSAREAAEFSSLGQQLFDEIERMAPLTVAMIDGDCYGGALDLSLTFDLRWASRRARFSHPGSRLGIVTGFGGTSRWKSVLDPSAARKLFLGNEVFDGAAAEAMGLVDQTFETFDGAEDSAIQDLIRLDPSSIAIFKQLIRRSEAMSAVDLQLVARRLTQLYAAEA